jgi:GT2 family glycosyltransferase
VIVNERTGFARNVNVGLHLASGDYVTVVGNDSRVVAGDVHDLCVPGTVTSPEVLGKPGIEPGSFHGAFWVAPSEVIDRVGVLDERFRARSSKTTTTSNACTRRGAAWGQIGTQSSQFCSSFARG